MAPVTTTYQLTTEEKLTSLASEAKHRTEAEIDKAKREVRKHT